MLLGHSTQSLLPHPAKCPDSQLNHDNGSAAEHWITENRFAFKTNLPLSLLLYKGVLLRNLPDQQSLCKDSLLLFHRVHKMIQMVHRSILNFAMHFDSLFNFKSQMTKLVGKKYLKITTIIVLFIKKKSVNSYAVKTEGVKCLIG